MADLLLDLVEYLTDEGVVAGDGVDTFRDFIPDQPDNAIFLFEYHGPGTTSGVESVERNIQVKVRSSAGNPDSARVKANQLFDTLDRPFERILDLRESTPPGTRWMSMAAKQTPAKIETDASNRVVYGFNLGVVTYRD